MDVRYKTFATRTSQDVKFDQLLRTKPLTTRGSSTAASYTDPPSSNSTNSTKFSVRKRVNVVSFTPGSESQELVTKSPEKPISNDTSLQQSTKSSYSDSLENPNVSPRVHLSTIADQQCPVQFPLTLTSSSILSDRTSLSDMNISSGVSTVEATDTTATYRSQIPPSAVCVKTSATFSNTLPRSMTVPLSKQSPFVPTSDASLANKTNHMSLKANPTSSGVTSVNPSHMIQSRSHSIQTLAEQQNRSGSSVSTKKKRLAYNPRSWQQEIESDETSPTKLPKLILQRDQSGSITIESSTSDVIKPSLGESRRLPAESHTNHGSDSKITSTASSSTTQKKVAPQSPVGFDFTDSDNEGTSEEPIRKESRQQEPLKCKLKNPNSTSNIAMNRIRLPRAHTVPASCHAEAPVTVNLCSGSRTSESFDTVVSEKSSKVNCQKLEYAMEEEDGDDEDIDDVKPWFCPDTRRGVTENKVTVEPKADNRVARTQKPLYTVVRKVKEAHVCQERGETQHLLDDVEYLVDGLNDQNQLNTRALSILTLANKCLTPSFRYLVNAHGLIKRICANLHDAHKDYTLALTSAGLFFILSRDRDPNIFDADSLPVMIRLLYAPDSITVDSRAGSGPQPFTRVNKEAERVRTRVRQLLEGLQHHQQQRLASSNHGAEDVRNTSAPLPVSATASSGGGIGKRPALLSSVSAPSSLTAGTAGLNTKHLTMTRQLTAADLVLESILNLGTRKAADWFQAELRVGRGLDRIADVAADAVDYLADLDPVDGDCRRRRRQHRQVWQSYSGLDEFALDKLRRVCYYTKLLENMTYMNSDNQTYLVRYRDRLLVQRFISCIRLCASHLPKPSICGQLQNNKSNANPLNDQVILVDCVLGIFRFLVNVSHNEFASDRLGSCPGMLETILHCVLRLPAMMPSNKRFDLLVLTLCLLANLCEHCPENRTRIVHLDIPRPRDSEKCAQDPTGIPDSEKCQRESDEDDEFVEDDEDDSDLHNNNSDDRTANGAHRRPIMVSALDQLVQLFLSREEQARNHEFERDDEDAAAAAERRRQEHSSAVNSDPTGVKMGSATHIEEAGLKWRLIEDRKASSGATCVSSMCGMGGGRMRSAGGRHRRKHRNRCPSRRRPPISRDIPCIEEEEENEDDENGFMNESGEEEASSTDSVSDEDEDDDSVGSGADVEFVADTQEEQDKLAEHMSQAKQHMEDSVVAAYVALLLGCIIQSSRRYADKIRDKLPDGQFRPLAIMLAKLLSFLSLTKGVGSSGSETILRIVRILEAQDKQEICLPGVTQSN